MPDCPILRVEFAESGLSATHDELSKRGGVRPKPRAERFKHSSERWSFGDRVARVRGWHTVKCDTVQHLRGFAETLTRTAPLPQQHRSRPVTSDRQHVRRSSGPEVEDRSNASPRPGNTGARG